MGVKQKEEGPNPGQKVISEWHGKGWVNLEG